MKLIHSHSISGRGDAADQFHVRITGLATADDGRLFAAGDRQVKVFSPKGELLQRFNISDAPWSIALDGESLWVAMQGRVEQLDYSGERHLVITEPNRLGLLTGIAAGNGRLLLADATHKCLWLFKGGHFRRRVGDDLNTRGFMIPNGVLTVAFDQRHSSFVVAHPQKHRVERYDLDGSSLGKFGRFGHGEQEAFGGCCNPTTCTVTPDGVILVSEKAPPHVKAFSAEGKFLAMTDEEAFDPSAKNQFLAADKSGCVYATDSMRGTIEVFRLSHDTLERKD